MMELIWILIDWFGGALVSLPLTVLLLFFIDRGRFCKKWGWAVLFVLYMNALLIIIGAPSFSYIVWDPSVSWVPFGDLSVRNLLGMALNIVLFIPFGGFLPIYFASFRKAWKTTLAGFLMSLFIETLQIFTFRLTDVNDLVMNTLGALAGYGIAKLILHPKKQDNVPGKDVPTLVATILLTLLCTVFIRYPLMELLLRFLPW